MINVHHLELFYYVAKHGGISAAARKIPYGIQQPAVSGQILQLEEQFGAKLFQRRPFCLTPAGARLFEFVEPFFSNLPEIAAEIRGETRSRLRLGASATVLREHFPEILGAHRKEYPALALTLRQVNQAEAESRLLQHEIDLAITELEDKPPAGIKSATLLKLPLILLAPKGSKWRSARDLLGRSPVRESLISLPGDEAISRLFQQGLRRAGVEWAPRIEVASLDLVETYVLNGFGIGVTAGLGTMPAGLRALSLPGFPSLVVGALWHGALLPVAESFLEAVKARAAHYAASLRRPGA